MKWDPAQYLQFADARGRPFQDLVARVGYPNEIHPSYVVDLGCGPGNLAAGLADRWPAADIEGVDSSAEMIERAQQDNARDGVRFSVADLRDWSPTRAVDVLTSNATLQWVPGHLDLLERLVGFVAPGGWLAFQVPGNFGEPTHTELAAVRTSARWQPVLGNLDLPQPAVEEPVTYVRRITELGCAVDAWETTYLQVLPGPDAVLEWMKGTGLRPVLSALNEEQQAEFVAEYAERLRAAYPQQSFGTVLPYRRIFVVARTPA
ncbi:MAG: trans-aconitate 2-methyltransferase [Pseudonocardiales bacterium]|nr:trans-aconitate 2-methyltransferase [Pseudonocardiales bacterium]